MIPAGPLTVPSLNICKNVGHKSLIIQNIQVCLVFIPVPFSS
jgi:hypothetical protein